MSTRRGNSKIKLVAAGSVALDSITTPFATRREELGGSLSYACAAASLFTRVGMVGIVGSDFAARHLALYHRLGIDLTGLQQVPGRTFRWAGIYEDDMINRRTLSTELNVFETFSPCLPENYREVPFLLLGNIAPSLQLMVLKQMRRPKFVVADTMDLWIKTTPVELRRVIRRTDALTLNDAEARLLTGEHNLRRCAAAIMRWGPRYVVIKKGEHGALLFSRGCVFIVPAYPVKAVKDPTGAGDSFAGGFMGALAEGGCVTEESVRRALVVGSVVASFAVEAFSLRRLAALSRPEIAERLGELRRMVVI